jgi:pyridoxal phosphate enzyme (YggS family)
MNVKDRFKKIQDRIAAAAARSGRNIHDITVVGVTKYATMAQIQELIAAGHFDLGESRVQQLQLRAQEVKRWLLEGVCPTLAAPEKINWHMIGHLQRNKASLALSLAWLIHSVDTLRLAEELNAQAKRHGQMAQLLLEINTTGEENKYGAAPAAARPMARAIHKLENVRLMGLMTMARQSENPEDSRPAFVCLRNLYEEILREKSAGPHFTHLSMGMSGDFEVAVEEGATLVRIGTALFGAESGRMA